MTLSKQPRLLMSILNWRFRDRDNPAFWYAHISAWLSNLRFNQPRKWLKSNPPLIILEVFVLISLFVAWVIPLFKG